MDPFYVPRLADGLSAVLLDAGNTLVSVDWDSVAALLARLGHAIEPDALRAAEYAGRRVVNHLTTGDPTSTDRSRGRAYFEETLRVAGVRAHRLEAACESLREANARIGLWRAVPPGTHAALERLRAAGLHLGVVSNSDGRLEGYLRDADLRRFFTVVVDSHLVGIEKPDRRIFELALGQIGARPGQAVHAGDMYAVDVVGARSAGVAAALIDPLMADPATDVVRVKNVAELANLILDGTSAAHPGDAVRSP